VKHLKFALPVGALLGGMRHLGNGEFIGTFPAFQSGTTGPVKFVTEGRTGENSTWPEIIELHVCDDPLENVQAQRRVACGQIMKDGAPINEIEFAALNGLSEQEYRAHLHPPVFTSRI
jgi:hypothetical protein